MRFLRGDTSPRTPRTPRTPDSIRRRPGGEPYKTRSAYGITPTGKTATGKMETGKSIRKAPLPPFSQKEKENAIKDVANDMRKEKPKVPPRSPPVTRSTSKGYSYDETNQQFVQPFWKEYLRKNYDNLYTDLKNVTNEEFWEVKDDRLTGLKPELIVLMSSSANGSGGYKEYRFQYDQMSDFWKLFFNLGNITQADLTGVRAPIIRNNLVDKLKNRPLFVESLPQLPGVTNNLTKNALPLDWDETTGTFFKTDFFEVAKTARDYITKHIGSDKTIPSLYHAQLAPFLRSLMTVLPDRPESIRLGKIDEANGMFWENWLKSRRLTKNDLKDKNREYEYEIIRKLKFLYEKAPKFTFPRSFLQNTPNIPDEVVRLKKTLFTFEQV